MKLQEKIDHLLNRTGVAPEGLLAATKAVSPAEIKELGHHCPHPKTARYLFERDSRVNSPWLSYGRGPILSSFIGGWSYVNDGGYLRDNVIIGRYCSIGRRVTIAAGTHPMEGLSTSMHVAGVGSAYDDTQRAEIGKPVPVKPKATVIHCDAWIGDGAIVMPGVRIAPGCVIGANAVVTKDTEPYGIYVGMPARKVSTRFPGDLAERLVASEWWDIDRETLNTLPTRNVFEFLEALESEDQPRPALDTYRIDNG